MVTCIYILSNTYKTPLLVPSKHLSAFVICTYAKSHRTAHYFLTKRYFQCNISGVLGLFCYRPPICPLVRPAQRARQKHAALSAHHHDIRRAGRDGLSPMVGTRLARAFATGLGALAFWEVEVRK